MMDKERLEEILCKFSETSVAVLGDFFLDLYIHMERSLSEFSLETHKEAFQAVAFRGQPGAAGVVTNNLAALGASCTVIGYVGQDGNGFTLKKALKAQGADLNHLIETQDRFTPTYIKPMMEELDGSIIELNRIDIINRTPNHEALNNSLVDRLVQVIETCHGVLVVEQVRLDGHGVMSPLLRQALSTLAVQYPDKFFLVDSRHFASAYQHISLKLNIYEAAAAAQHQDLPSTHIDPLSAAKDTLRALWDQHHKPVFITLGDLGVSGIDKGHIFHHPGYQIQGPVDTVGAGDSVMAAIGLALCAGATSSEAAYIGNLVGSLTVEQLGTTGVATQQDILQRHHEYQQQMRG